MSQDNLHSAQQFPPFEVNVIFKARVEERSGTPAFKRVPVFVYAKNSQGRG